MSGVPSSILRKSAKSSSGRRVSFSQTAKTWSGLKIEHRHYDAFMERVLMKCRIANRRLTPQESMAAVPPTFKNGVKRLLADFVRRFLSKLKVYPTGRYLAPVGETELKVGDEIYAEWTDHSGTDYFPGAIGQVWWLVKGNKKWREGKFTINFDDGDSCVCSRDKLFKKETEWGGNAWKVGVLTQGGGGKIAMGKSHMTGHFTPLADDLLVKQWCISMAHQSIPSCADLTRGKSSLKSIAARC